MLARCTNPVSRNRDQVVKSKGRKEKDGVVKRLFKKSLTFLVSVFRNLFLITDFWGMIITINNYLKLNEI